MSQRVMLVHPDVLTVDISEATAYYDEIDPNLGDRLSQLIVDALQQIEAFAVDEDTIQIDALLHLKRDPALNESILRSRG